MEKLEETVLRFVAGEVFCSLADIEALIQRETEGSSEDASVTALALLTSWEDRGWAETAEMDPGGQIWLTDQAFTDLPWLPRQP